MKNEQQTTCYVFQRITLSKFGICACYPHDPVEKTVSLRLYEGTLEIPNQRIKTRELRGLIAFFSTFFLNLWLNVS